MYSYDAGTYKEYTERNIPNACIFRYLPTYKILLRMVHSIGNQNSESLNKLIKSLFELASQHFTAQIIVNHKIVKYIPPAATKIQRWYRSYLFWHSQFHRVIL